MAITAEDIKKLREMTSCGIMECKKALEETNGNFDEAKKVLQKRGLEIAAKKGSREAKDGRIEVYVHPGNKVVAMVEVCCETDFVAKNDDFIALSKGIAMHIAALNPKYVRREDVPEEQIKEGGDELLKQICLLEQPFVKDPSKTINDCVTSLVATVGENIFVNRFVRYKVGEID